MEASDHISWDDHCVEVMEVPGVMGVQAKNDLGLPKAESEEDFIWYLAHRALCS